MADDLRPSPLAAWSALTEQQRQEVTRLAKQGHRHPNPAVAAAAEGWAEVLLHDTDLQREHRWWWRALGIPAFILLVETGLSGWFERRADRRWATRVLAARAHEG